MKKVISLFPTALDVGPALWRYAYFSDYTGHKELNGFDGGGPHPKYPALYLT
ncbi:MAG: hypothetical protein PUE80_09745 [bacterium]|nr:hypothetical protein [bacterium]